MPNSSVAIVMSTYNGEQHLSDQIDSVLCQTVPVDLFIRDDGSQDSTPDIIKRYQRNYSNIFYQQGSNHGCAVSFLKALSLVPSTYEFFSFCDQDDIWHKDKVSRALAAMSKNSVDHTPLLYCSEYNYCDATMNFESRSRLAIHAPDFTHLLFENYCSGNTMMFNRAARFAALRANPNRICIHDWWVAQIAACFGSIIHDPAPSLEYRRTESSVSSCGKRGLELLYERMTNVVDHRKMDRIIEQMKHFLELFGDEMTAEKKMITERMVKRPNRSKALFSRRLRAKISDEIALRILFAAGIV